MKLKKIGILTLPIVDNYGGILQATALYGFLKDKGYAVVFLRNDSFVKTKVWKRMAAFVLRNIPYQNIKGIRKNALKIANHARFIERNIPVRTKRFDSRIEMLDVIRKEKFDAIVVGSDQVWRWDYIKDDFARYFLDFVDRKVTRKIAYAASFGKSHWQDPSVQQDVSRLLLDFHAVSTRESDGVILCEQLGRRDCHHVLDPTLLVGADFYNALSPVSERSSNRKVLLTYVLDEAPNKSSFIDSVLHELGEEYDIYQLGLQSQCSVPDWVAAFRSADFIVTDSFHGMVFSVLFNKPFFAIGNPVRGGSRFTSFLKQLGLCDRLIDESDLPLRGRTALPDTSIDYISINQKLETLRRYSKEFLINSIEGDDG